MDPTENFPGGALEFFTTPEFEPGTIPPRPNVDRNTFRGPYFFGLDLSLQKSFRLPTMAVLGSGANIQLRWNLFNAFNNLNLQNLTVQDGNVIGSTTSATADPRFGQSQAALAGRVMRLQARFSF
jgi:hypothetical protein